MHTDNNHVAHLQSVRLGAVEQRWVAQLSSIIFEVKYRAGRENTNADALSAASSMPKQLTTSTVGAVTTAAREGGTPAAE